jgi:hypothetical protein
MEKIPTADAALVERKIEQRNLPWLRNLRSDRDPRIGQQIADQRDAAMLGNQFLGSRNRRIGQAAIVLDDQFERLPENPTLAVMPFS